MSEEKVEEKQEELPESMREDPVGGCRGLFNGAIISVIMVGIGWLIWWLTHR